MSETAIEVTNVSRVFRRYQHPRYRIMELFGLPIPKSGYDEFQALGDINLTVNRGERVALIGRNGAGKSTLLSIICGRLLPSSGDVRVNGRIQALMELGTGFHPDFTARENVIATLAMNGITGRKARGMVDDVIDFAELEDFQDQPVKTFSAGMYARLAFSASTAIEPDILIIDEVLGAGDAYFASKSAERMRRLTIDTGATVLFVSHDMSSVERLCERAIWIDHGRSIMEGSALQVSKAYYASVLKYEEERLSVRTQQAKKRIRKRAETRPAEDVEIAFRRDGSDGEAPAIARIVLREGEGELAVLDLGQAEQQESMNGFQVAAWGEATTVDGLACRKLAPATAAPAPSIALRIPEAVTEPRLEVLYRPGSASSVQVVLKRQETETELGRIEANTDAGWQTVDFSAGISQPADADTEADSQDTADDRWETPDGRIIDIVPADAAGEEKFVFGLREPVFFRIDFDSGASLDRFWLALIIYDAKGNRVYFDALEAPAIEKGKGYRYLAGIPDFCLRQGDYVLSVDFLKEFSFQTVPGVRFPFIAHWDRSVFFKVDEGYRGIVDLGLVAMKASVKVEERQ
ncbi:ABC transporter ATP-binding protein [Bosea sp. WAO]|uniref:ABC transporter ATP-binding protein n=1 Tax=Bosea sp. WAO TaxID=406341 RepID=UPI000830E0D9|nr:ABC transporter ATP-binding protein [Bosea sp. WAO]